MKSERQVAAVTSALRPYLTEELAQERARNIAQALIDEDTFSPSIRAFRREEIVRHAFVFWKLAPEGFHSNSLQMRAEVLQALLEGT